MFDLASYLPEFLGKAIWWLPLLLVWSVVWKGLALWRAARLSERWWFVAILLINTLGVLEILYLYVFSRSQQGSGAKPPVAPGQP